MFDYYNNFLYLINVFVDYFVSFKITLYDYYKYYLGQQNDILSCTLLIDENNFEDISFYYKEFKTIDWDILKEEYTNITNNSKILIKYIVDDEKYEIILKYGSKFNTELFNQYLEGNINNNNDNNKIINLPKIVYSDVTDTYYNDSDNSDNNCNDDNNKIKDITMKIRKFAGLHNDFHLFFNLKNPIKISDIFDDDYENETFTFFTNSGNEFQKKYNDVIYEEITNI